jgi:hypothetical protein
MPITLDVSGPEIKRLKIVPGARITLRDFRDEQPLAILTGALAQFPELTSQLRMCTNPTR